MKLHNTVSALALLPLIACGAPADETEATAEEMLAALPSAELLTVPYPGAGAAARVAGDAEAPQASCQASSDEGTAYFYQQGCHVVSSLNGTVNDVLGLIQRVTSTEPSRTGESAYAWGPFDNGTVTLVFAMRKNEDGTYAYQLNGKASGADDATALTVLRGEIEAGVDLAHNVGTFEINFDNMYAVDPSNMVAGLAQFHYDRLGTQTGVEARLNQILGEDGVRHNLVADYDLNDDRSGELRYGFTDDIVVKEGSTAQEVQKVQTRWLSTGAGRSDATISGGDLGDATGYVSECWSSSYEEVFLAASWAEGSRGDEALCVFEEPEFP